MDLVTDYLVLSGLVLLPLAAIVAGGFVLGWLQRFAPERGAGSGGFWSGVASIPFAALSAAMVLAPVVVAVWAVIAEEEPIAYLATVGFALGALALSALAASYDASRSMPQVPRMPGVVLTSAVGFFVALTSFLGGALARSLGVEVGDGWRVLVPIAVALVVGGLAVAAYRRRTDDDASPAPEPRESVMAHNE